MFSEYERLIGTKRVKTLLKENFFVYGDHFYKVVYK